MSADVDEPVYLEEWNPYWQVVAAELADECLASLGDEALAVQHIGSTAVPGLVAKPVVDLQVGVRSGRAALAAGQLARQGWTHLGEAGVPGREYLRRRSGQHANVHVVVHGGTIWQENLLLREYLRRDAAARERYTTAKRQAALASPTLLAYSGHKAEVVAQLLDEARAR